MHLTPGVNRVASSTINNAMMSASGTNSNGDPSSSVPTSPCQLLFFDTFSHDNGEALNLDLVQFPSPVMIEEVRVIPLGAKVPFPGGFRLGATNPNEIQLEFFVNNLVKPGAATFESLGSLHYDQAVKINLQSTRLIPTDGLVLKGLYTTITLAVYGTLCEATPEQLALTASQQQQDNSNNVSVNDTGGGAPPIIDVDNRTFHSHPPPLPSQERSVLQTEQRNEILNGREEVCEEQENRWRRSLSHEKSRSPQSTNRYQGNADVSPSTKRRSVEPDKEESPPKEKPPQPITDDLFEEMSDISDDDIPDVSGKEEMDTEPEKTVPEGSGEKSVDKERPKSPSDSTSGGPAAFLEKDEDMMEEISDEEEEWYDEISQETLPPSVWSDLQKECQIRTFDAAAAAVPKMPDVETVSESLFEEQYESLFRQLKVCATGECNSEWISNLEECTTVIRDCKGFNLPDKVQDLVMESALKALNLDLAIKQEVPTDKVRHIKSGLDFVLALSCIPTEKSFEKLICRGLQYHAVRIVEDKSMAHSIKGIAFQILDRTLKYKIGLELFCGTRTSSEDLENMVSKVEESAGSPYFRLNKLLQNSSSRVKLSVSAISCKAHFYQLCLHFAEKTRILCETPNAPEEAVDDLVEIYENLTAIVKQAVTIMGFPNKLMPVGFSFQNDDQLCLDPYPVIFGIFKATNLLENIYLSLASGFRKLLTLGDRLLQTLIEQEHGPRYFCERYETSTGIIKLCFSLAKHDTNNSSLRNLGVTIATATNAFQSVLALYCDLKSNDPLCCLEDLQSLYAMTFQHHEKMSLVKVLRFHLSLLARTAIMMQPSDESNENESFKTNTAVTMYAMELLLTTLCFSDNVDCLKRGQNDLAELSSALMNKDDPLTTEINGWLTPLMDAKGDVAKLCELVKKNAENINPMSKELMASSRLILSQCQKSSFTSSSHQHVEAIIVAMMNGLVETYTTLIERICDCHPQPRLHLAAFSSRASYERFSLLHVVVRTMRRILRQVIQSRGGDFKDTTSFRTLFRLFVLCSAVQPDAACHSLAEDILHEVIEFLSEFTLPVVNIKDEEKASIAGSCWAVMLTELIDFMMHMPHRYIPCLKLFQELLPKTLPIRVSSKIESLSEEAQESLMNSRKLWGAHIIQVETKVKSMIQSMLYISEPELRREFILVCLQIADLSPLTASMVAETIVDALKGQNEFHTVVLSSLVALTGEPPIKSSLAELTIQNDENDSEEAESILKMFNRLLLKDEYKLDNKKLILGVFANMVDDSICIVDLDRLAGATQFLSKSVYSQIFVMTLQLMENCFPQDDSLAIPCFHILSSMVSNQVGRKILSQSISDIIQLVSSTKCSSSEVSMSVLTFAKRISASTVNHHGLFKCLHERCSDISKNLDSSKVPEDMEALLVKLESLCSNENMEPMDTGVSDEDNGCHYEEHIPSLHEQFSQRPLISTNISRRQGVVCMKNGDAISDQVRVDLLAVSQELKEFDLLKETQSVCLERGVDAKKAREDEALKKSILEEKAKLNKHIISSFKSGGTGRPVASAPPSGTQGGSRGGFSRMGQRGDGFRSRPPNTSRPPSLHVDDFLLLQQRGQQPTGPTGYNKQSIKAAKELFAKREAEQQGKSSSLVGFREATKEPVYSPDRFVPRGSSRRGSRVPSDGGGKSGGSGRPPRGWSPDDRRKFYGDRRGSSRDRRLLPHPAKGSSRGDDRPPPRHHQRSLPR